MQRQDFQYVILIWECFFPSNFDQLFAHTPANTARVMFKGSTAVCLHQLWGQDQGLKF